MDDLTEEQKISAQFAAIIMGGELSDGPPDPQSPLGRWLASGGGQASLLAIWEELGVIRNGVVVDDDSSYGITGDLPEDESPSR